MKLTTITAIEIELISNWQTPLDFLKNVNCTIPSVSGLLQLLSKRDGRALQRLPYRSPSFRSFEESITCDTTV